MAEQAAQLEFAHSSNFTTDIAEQFAQELLDFAGPAFRDGAVFFTSGGSESVESALKLARQYQVESGHPERYQIVSRRQSYHGATLGAMAVSGNEARRSIYLPMLREFPKANIPYCYRCPYDCGNGCADCGLKYAAEVEQAIAETNGTAAAFIMEPVSGATLGAAAPSPSYVKRVAEICHEQQVLLIADEVMTGFGRTGRRFAMDHFERCSRPHRHRQRYLQRLRPARRRHRATPRRRSHRRRHWHAAAWVHLQRTSRITRGRPCCLKANRRKQVSRGRRLASAAAAWPSVLNDELQKLWKFDSVGDVRGLGLLWAVEFVADRANQATVSRRKEVRRARLRLRPQARRTRSIPCKAVWTADAATTS